MSKAILVIDMPSDCYHCQLHDYEYRWCYGKDESSVLTEEDIESKRVEGCPLKPMPQKKEAYASSYTERAYEFSAKTHPLYADGWNDCLMEIEK